MGRYIARKKINNNSTLYKEILKDRGIENVTQYKSPKFISLDNLNLSTQRHVWQREDRLAKLADEFYGDATKWWVIAFFNKRPTDSHYKVGDVIFVPFPLENILRAVY
jgi:nucleoid-associated protein YgaU